MDKKLPPQDMDLFRRTGEILHYLWDPIGIMGAPEARDEYDSYVPSVFQLVLKNKAEKEIADFLEKIQVEKMGFLKTPGNYERLLEIAEILIRSRKWVFKSPP